MNEEQTRNAFRKIGMANETIGRAVGFLCNTDPVDEEAFANTLRVGIAYLNDAIRPVDPGSIQIQPAADAYKRKQHADEIDALKVQIDGLKRRLDEAPAPDYVVGLKAIIARQYEEIASLRLANLPEQPPR